MFITTEKQIYLFFALKVYTTRKFYCFCWPGIWELKIFLSERNLRDFPTTKTYQFEVQKFKTYDCRRAEQREHYFYAHSVAFIILRLQECRSTSSIPFYHSIFSDCGTAVNNKHESKRSNNKQHWRSLPFQYSMLEKKLKDVWLVNVSWIFKR